MSSQQNNLKPVELLVTQWHFISTYKLPVLFVCVCMWMCMNSSGLLDNEDIHLMMKGSNMVKIRSQRWQKSRNLRLLEDGLTVWCESTKSSRKAKAQQTCKCDLNLAVRLCRGDQSSESVWATVSAETRFILEKRQRTKTGVCFDKSGGLRRQRELWKAAVRQTELWIISWHSSEVQPPRKSSR